MLAAAARRGADVRGLIWRSHLDRFQFSAEENRHLGDEIEAAGGQCLLDMRVRPGLAPPEARRAAPSAAAGARCRLRRRHRPVPQPPGRRAPPRRPAAPADGRGLRSPPPWHDVQLAIRGPAVGDVETVFRERWEDPAPLSRNPVHRRRDSSPGAPDARLPAAAAGPAVGGQRRGAAPAHLSGPPPRVPVRPAGERSVARAYSKALARARSLIYLEDQYLWSADVARVFAERAGREPGLRLIAVIPGSPTRTAGSSLPPNLVGRGSLAMLHAAGGDRFAVYGLENEAGTPSTCTRRSASSTTPGPASARTTSTGDPGPTTAS